MSAEKGQVNVVVVRVVCVLILAALAAFLFVRMQDRAPADTEQATIVAEPTSHELAPAPAAADTSAAAASAAQSASRDAGSGAASKTAAKQLPRLLDLGAGTCVPCKMMAPILDEMKVTFKGQLDVEFIDVRKDNAAAKQYGIQVIPTQIFFDASGNEVFRHQGFFSREDMLAKWKELGVKLDG
jgi:thiol-disulfide isomerase/thioredoxin